MRTSRSLFLLFLVGCAAVEWGGFAPVELAGAGEPPMGIASEEPPLIQLTLIDDAAIHGATFQSNNQKIVSNRRGIFATYIKTRNKEYTAQKWRLVASTDGGESFRTLFEETAATNPPVLETDAEDNLYVVRPDFLDGHAYLYRFLASRDYREPIKTRIPGGSAGKYALAIDLQRGQLYYFAHNNTFHVIGLDGNIRSSIELLKPGENAVLQYPSLCLGGDHTLYAAWTTVANGRYLYWDIHAMRSRDGGQKWEKLDGTPLTFPIVADDGGPSDRITLDDEFEVTTWLSNFLAVGSKLHFVYETQSDPRRERYVRYDLNSGRKDHEFQPEFKGETVSLRGLDGCFAATNSVASSLYCVMKDAGPNRLACLKSDDDGQSWHDHAVSSVVSSPYAIGGCRAITHDGWIIGTFTDAIEPSDASEGKSKVYFFKIKADRKR